MSDNVPVVVPAKKPRRIIGGSNAAAILGYSTWATPYQCWLEMTGQVSPDAISPETKLFFQRRARWEPVVVQMLREELDVEITAVNKRYMDPNIPFFGCEIDWEWRDEDGSIQNGETKTVSTRGFTAKEGWGEAGSDEVPIVYEAQVQFGLGVTGRQKAILAAMVGLDEMVFYQINRNDQIINTMRERLSHFWNHNVLKMIPPDATTVTDLTAMYPASLPLDVEATPDVAVAALRLRALKAQTTAIEAESDALEFIVKRAMGDRERLLVDGKPVFTWKESDFSILDQSGLKAAQPAVHRQFMRRGRHRIFRKTGWK